MITRSFISVLLAWALLLNATAPAWLSLQATDGERILLCTADGYRYVTPEVYDQLLADGGGTQDAPARPHCPLCIVSAAMADVPVSSAEATLSTEYSAQMECYYRQRQQRVSARNSTPQNPRAPPVTV